MSYVSIGAVAPVCPGQEIWHDDIGACSCPAGLITSGIVGECISPAKEKPWVTVCPPYTPIPQGVNCWCPDLHALDDKRMCTREAYSIMLPMTTIVGGASSKTALTPPGGATAPLSLATMTPGAWLVAAVAVGGVAYLIGAS